MKLGSRSQHKQTELKLIETTARPTCLKSVCDLGVFTSAQTNSTKGENEPEFDLNRLNNTGIKVFQKTLNWTKSSMNSAPSSEENTDGFLDLTEKLRMLHTYSKLSITKYALPKFMLLLDSSGNL